MATFVRPPRPSRIKGEDGAPSGAAHLPAGRQQSATASAAAGRSTRSPFANIRDDPRQTTLTQIDFVRRNIPPPDDLELEEISTSPSPRKHQRAPLAPPPPPPKLAPLRHSSGTTLDLQARKRQKLEPPQGSRAKSTSAAEGATKSPETRLSTSLSPDPALEDDTYAHSNESSLEVTRHPIAPPDIEIEMEEPKTPPKKRRTIVPSSQSPESTPLTIRTVSRRRSGQTASPLSRRSHRITARDLSESPTKQKSSNTASRDDGGSKNAAAEEPYDNSKPGRKEVRPLRLMSSSSTERVRRGTKSPLETSPDVSKQTQPRRSPRNREAMEPPRWKPSQVRSSQMTTQDPTQFQRETSAREHRADAIPSSQITTQDPTQFSPDRIPPRPTTPPLSPERPPAKSGWAHQRSTVSNTTTESSGNLSRVPSSQATTVVPSSDSIPSAIQTPKAKRLRTSKKSARKGSRRVRSPDVTSSPLPPVPPSFQWDGKELTDSQLLPDSLINWTIPLPSSMSTQESLASIDDNEGGPEERITTADRTPTKETTRKSSPTPRQKRKPSREVKIKEEPISQPKANGPGSRGGHGSKNKKQSRPRIKEEPHD